MEVNDGGEINKLDNRGHGPQGIDKAPGEETPQDDVQFIQQSQKGKKVDADLTREEERPIEQDEDL
jgi:hypothetical protein